MWSNRRMLRTVAAVLAASFGMAGCAETVLIRSVPPGAAVYVNDEKIGTTPVVFRTTEIGHRSFDYKVEKEGFPIATGPLTTRIAPGRIVAGVFTAGILLLVRPIRYFSPNPIDIAFVSPLQVTGVGTLRLYQVSNAVVFDGECDGLGACWIALPSGERCTGEYIKENQGTTTMTTRGGALGGYGTGVGLVGGAFTSSSTGQEVANTIRGVALLRCPANIIDCSMSLDAFAPKGFGECKDSKGIQYRATLSPKRYSGE